MKKFLIWISVLMLLAASVFAVCAVDPDWNPDPTLVQEARDLYKQCLYASGRESFHGMCGLMTSYQLWKLGINQELEIHDGNKQFDAYKTRQTTTGGHDIVAYSVEEHGLKAALELVSQNGTRPVRNILVGFQWTDTEAGGLYGHACLINEIRDGIVYFTESFDYAFGKLEGQTITCTIDSFVDFFDGWTAYEGIIYFGDRQYANTCQSNGTDLYVQLRFESNLRSQPCLLGKADCVRLRSLAAGEVLHATGVFVSEDGDLFYRIRENGVTGYVSANAVHVLQRREDGVCLEKAQVPTSVAPGDKVSLSGKVTAAYCQLSRIRLEVADGEGNVLLQALTESVENGCALSALQEQLPVHTLPAGEYTLTLVAETAYGVAAETEVSQEQVEKTLLRQPLCVGVEPQLQPAAEELSVKDGWFSENGTWYCYAEGKPCTGWVTRIGVEYFLKEDGSVTTGWMEENGWIRYFSATGALCEGWVTTREGTYYWISDGVLATGLQELEGKCYFFGVDGKLQTSGTVTIDGVSYKIAFDGTACPIE